MATRAIQDEIAAHPAFHCASIRDLRPDLSTAIATMAGRRRSCSRRRWHRDRQASGFHQPERFLRLLKAIEADPSPENATSPTTARWWHGKRARHGDARGTGQAPPRHTMKLGGLTTAQKYLDRDSHDMS
jgi:hypothetical protein